MAKAGNRGYVPCSSVLYANKGETKEGYIKKAVSMSTNRLKARLCSLGPKKCPDCGLCEYGKEYAKRSQHHDCT